MKLLLNVNLHLKVLPFHMLSAWVKHQIVNINIQGFSSGQKFCFMRRISNGLKILFFPMERKHIFLDSLLNS